MADNGAGTEAAARAVSLLWPGAQDFCPFVYTCGLQEGPGLPGGTGEETAKDKHLDRGLFHPPPHIHPLPGLRHLDKKSTDLHGHLSKKLSTSGVAGHCHLKFSLSSA